VPLLVILLVLVVLAQGGAHLLMIYESRRACAGAREKLPAQMWWPFLFECVLLPVALLCWAFGELIPRSRRWDGDGTGSGNVVALVHELSTSPVTMRLLARRLAACGWRPVIVEFSSEGADLYAKASDVGAALARLCQDHGVTRIDVVAHGVGGLLVRAAARFDGAGGLLGNVVTLGTPHQGTALASLITGPRFAQLRPGSPFLQRLAAGDDVPGHARVTAIASSFDAVVFPLESAYYPGAFNITVDGVGHLALLVSSRVWELVLENLEDRGPSASQAA